MVLSLSFVRRHRNAASGEVPVTSERRRLLLEILGFVLVVALVATYAVRRGGGLGEPATLNDQRIMMGTVVSVTVFTHDEERGREAIEAAFAEVARVEALTSRHAEESDVSRINEQGRRAERLSVSRELATILERSLHFSRISGGAFDVTVAPLVVLWLGPEGMRVPSVAAIRAALPKVDYRKLKVNTGAGTLNLPAGMAIDLDGIAKGHAVDRAVRILRLRGIEAAIVDAGGNIGFLGDPPRGGMWRVGVKHPREDGLLGTLLIERGSVATSGDYQHFAVVNGVRYHHLLDPATGRPTSGVMSVTITAARAIDADALSTAVFVLGAEKGMKLVEELDGVEAVIVTGGETVDDILVSSGLRERFVEGP
jgi:thiamine biosynthesis lipoprotein